MPRVLIAGFCSLPGANRVGVQLTHIVRALIRHHTVDVLVVRRGDQAYVERFGQARVLRVPVPDGAFVDQVDAYRRALRRQIEGADYDIVHVRDGWAGLPVLGVQEQFRFATVFDVTRSPMAEGAMVAPEAAAELARDEEECVRRADVVLVPTEHARRHIVAHVPGDRVHLVPAGVDVDQFDWDDPPSKGPPRVLLCGTLAPGRGVRVLLRAMLDVANRSDAELVLAGAAQREFLKSLKTAVRDLGLADRVDFTGAIEHDDVPALIASSTVCVAPGAADVGVRPAALYPTKILEYMACRRPVIAPRRSTVTMLMRDEQHGVLFEPGKPADLAEQLLRLLSDSKLRARVARSGYDLVRRAHTASSTRRELRRAYDWLANQSGWRERFLESLDDPGGMRPNLVADGGIVEAIAPYESDGLLGEDTEARAVTGGDFGDVTRVEEIRVGSSRGGGDDWVVSSSGETLLPVVDEESGPHTREGPPDEAAPMMETNFVAGEFHVATPEPEVRVDEGEVDVGGMFTAMTPLLGTEVDDLERGPKRRPAGRRRPLPTTLSEESSTQVALAPPPPRKDTRAETSALPGRARRAPVDGPGEGARGEGREGRRAGGRPGGGGREGEARQPATDELPPTGDARRRSE